MRCHTKKPLHPTKPQKPVKARAWEDFGDLCVAPWHVAPVQVWKCQLPRQSDPIFMSPGKMSPGFWGCGGCFVIGTVSTNLPGKMKSWTSSGQTWPHHRQYWKSVESLSDSDIEVFSGDPVVKLSHQWSEFHQLPGLICLPGLQGLFPKILQLRVAGRHRDDIGDWSVDWWNLTGTSWLQSWKKKRYHV